MQSVRKASPVSGQHLSGHLQLGAELYRIVNCVIIINDVCSELPEKQEQLHAVYKVLEELPPANFSTLERLIFHLVR